MLNRQNGPIKCPCYGCDKRTIDCHGSCKAYAEFTEENEKFKAQQRKEANKAYWARYLNNR